MRQTFFCVSFLGKPSNEVINRRKDALSVRRAVTLAVLWGNYDGDKL